MFTDTVSDFITRIRNASASRKDVIEARNSKLVYEIAELLKKGGYIQEIKADGRILTITLNPEFPLVHIKALSKPGLRRYVKSTAIPRPRSGLGMVILTTPKGVLTGQQAHKQKVGGELVCEVW